MQKDYVVIYHGTAEADLPSILQEGLVPSRGHGADTWASEHGRNVAIRSSHRAPSVYVSTKQWVAAEFAELAAEETNSKPVVLKLHVPKAEFKTRFCVDELSDPIPRNLFEQMFGGGVTVAFRTEKTIPPAWIVGRASTNHNGYHLNSL